MQPTIILAICLSTILGVALITSCIVFSRYKFRKNRYARSIPVDPRFEARMNAEAAGEKEGEEGGGGGRGASFGGKFGITPLAGVGPGGTRTYLNGWFGLDAPVNGSTKAGWGDVESSTLSSTITSVARESHFSRASRAASRRSQRSTTGGGAKLGTSESTTEFGARSHREEEEGRRLHEDGGDEMQMSERGGASNEQAAMLRQE